MPRFQNGANHAKVTVVNIVCVLCRVFFLYMFLKKPTPQECTNRRERSVPSDQGFGPTLLGLHSCPHFPGGARTKYSRQGRLEAQASSLRSVSAQVGLGLVPSEAVLGHLLRASTLHLGACQQSLAFLSSSSLMFSLCPVFPFHKHASPTGLEHPPSSSAKILSLN